MEQFLLFVDVLNLRLKAKIDRSIARSPDSLFVLIFLKILNYLPLLISTSPV